MKRTGKEDRQPVTSGSQFSKGDVIEIDGNARLRLSLLPGLLAEVAGNSELQIEQVRIAKDGNAMFNAMRAREARLRLMHGSLTAIVEKSSQAAGTLTIDTPFGIVTVMNGSLCKIDVSDKDARIICLRGHVQMQAKDGNGTALEAGFFEDWPAGAGVAKAADEDAQVQGDVVAGFNSRRELLSLEKRESFAPVPWRR
jgi:hypothetical protein